MRSAKPEFKIENVNAAPFRNMVTSAVAGNADSFNYWRERLRSTGATDAHEYVARAIYATYAAGVIVQCSSALPSLSSIVEGTTPGSRKNIPGLEERWQKAVSARDSVMAIIQSCLDVIRDFLSSGTHAQMTFLFEASEPFSTLNALAQDNLLKLNTLYQIQQQKVIADVTSLLNYIDSALSWVAKENLEVVALIQVAAVLEQLRETPSFPIFTTIAIKLATLIQLAKGSLGEELKASVEASASQAASAVPADRIEFAEVADAFSDAPLTLPQFVQICKVGLRFHIPNAMGSWLARTI